MMNRLFFYGLSLLLFLISGLQGIAQTKNVADHDSLLSQVNATTQWPRMLEGNPRIVKIGDSLWLVSGLCKPLLWRKFSEVKPTPVTTAPTLPASKAKLITVHGNIRYDFLYRSYIDTPFTQRDLQQHTVQASLVITVRDKYPLRLNIGTRASNSPYFSNFFDAGLLLDQFTFTKDAKKRLADKIMAQRFNTPDLNLLNEALEEKKQRYADLKLRLSQPDVLQRIIEEREKEYYRSKKKDTSAVTTLDTGFDLAEFNRKFTYKSPAPEKIHDTSVDTKEEGDKYSDFIARKRRELDSLQFDISSLQKKADSLTHLINKKTVATKDAIYKAKNRNELKKIEAEHGIRPDRMEKSEAFLSNLRSVGIGRTMIDYTELTAQGISLTGLNVEYNDTRVYAALAAGQIDYGFRNLPGRSNRQRGQHLLMTRVGIGDKDRRALIFSMFTGRKFNYGSAFSDTVSDKQRLAGYSLEAIWAKDDNTSLSAELAKSTRPLSGTLRDNRELNSLVDFSDRSNLGVNIKGQTRIKKTDTRLSGLYRKTGENFQSFSLFTYNTDQVAWNLKVDQILFRNKVDFTAMLRRNDFTNPFTDKTFKTSTVFTSLQTTVRIPRWPVFSVGYFPGSQLYMIDRERIRENAYYILNGSLIYTYAAGNARMTSSAIYNKYSSKGTDSGFVAYKGINYLASQSVMWRKFQLQAGYAFTDQEQLKFYTLELNADYNPVSFIRIGLSGKYNRLNTGKTYWGNRAQAGIEIKKLGTLQLLYEKSFLPTIYQDLFPVEMGRVTWFKYF